MLEIYNKVVVFGDIMWKKSLLNCRWLRTTKLKISDPQSAQRDEAELDQVLEQDT